MLVCYRTLANWRRRDPQGDDNDDDTHLEAVITLSVGIDLTQAFKLRNEERENEAIVSNGGARARGVASPGNYADG